MTSDTLSFCLFDDLRAFHGPVHVPIQAITPEKLRLAIEQLLHDYKKQDIYDKAGFFNDVLVGESELDETINIIIKSLMKKHYYVCNRWNKYYVIAFSINYIRFDIYSKDCDKKLIHWRDNDQQDPIKGTIQNPNYNENPVITLMNQLGD